MRPKSATQSLELPPAVAPAAFENTRPAPPLPPPVSSRDVQLPAETSVQAPPPRLRTNVLAPGRTRPTDDSPRDSSSAETTGEDVREDSGGAGNETDVEDEDGLEEESPATADEAARNSDLLGGGAAMYPFPSTEGEAAHLHYGPLHYRRRNLSAAPPSSAEVLLSSATSAVSASDLDGAEEARFARPFKRLRRRSVDSTCPLQHPHVPRLRRIGALGISVHSDSDPDEPNISGLDSADLRPERNTGESTSDNTRATDLGISSDQLRKSLGGGSLTTGARRSRRRGSVAVATFRGVVDKLAIQNRELRERVRRYEVDGVPTELKRDRLFEIRFFEGLPAAKRVELEDYLTRYVQTYTESSLAPAEENQDGVVAPLRPRLENRNLAGPSYSGVEPPSLSGTGSGMRLPPTLDTHSASTLPDSPYDVGAPITEPRAVAVAHDIVASLEALFQSSLLRTVGSRTPTQPAIPLPPLDPSRKVPNTRALAESNEKYFANLLSHDFLSQGFVYLNLALTMAQIYRYNVTVAFVQRAVRQFSQCLELSEDGGRIRWKGPRTPVFSESAALNVDVGDVVRFSKPSTANKPTEAPSVGGASSAPSRSTLASGCRDPSSKETIASGSGSSRESSSINPSSLGGTLLANSLAPSSRTGQTSLPSSGRKMSSSESAVRPVRPTAAVLQPMNRLQRCTSPDQNMSLDPVSTAEGVPPGGNAGARTAATAAAGADAPGVVDAPPAAQDKSSSGKDGSVALSAANLDAHNLGIELAESRRTHTSSQAVDSTTASASHSVGALVFYGNGLFCSDLTKEREGPVPPPALPQKDGRTLRPLGAAGYEHDDLLSLGAEDMAVDDDDDDEEPIDLDATVLDIFDDEARAARYSSDGVPSSMSGSGSNSAGSSLQRLRMSGMTPTFPADFFTVVVKTRHQPNPNLRGIVAGALPTPDSPDQVHLGARAPSFSSILPASKRPRLAPTVSAEVLSTREIYHGPRVQMRYPQDVTSGDSDTISPVDCPEDCVTVPWSRGQLLTSSNLAKLSGSEAVHQPTANDHLVPLYLPPTPSPPHHDQSDYLLSLSAPSHSWSPEESGFHTAGDGNPEAPAPHVSGSTGLKRKLPPPSASSRGGPVRRVRIDGAGNGSTLSSSADERPISLDDIVEVPQRSHVGLSRAR